MKYRKDMPKSNYSSSGDAGCVKAASENKVEMIKGGGQKYGTGNNPAELKQRTDALAKMVK